MRLVRNFPITGVEASNTVNAPFKVVATEGVAEEVVSLTFDTATAEEHNLPLSLSLVDRNLHCSFESLELNPPDGGFMSGRGGLERGDLIIELLERREVTEPRYHMIPPDKHEYTRRTIKLSSSGKGDGIHPHILPCPFYELTLHLTEEEYQECKALPPTAFFRFAFHLTTQDALVERPDFPGPDICR